MVAMNAMDFGRLVGRRPLGRAGPGLPGRGARVRQPARGVRREDRRVPDDQEAARRHGLRGRRGARTRPTPRPPATTAATVATRESSIAKYFAGEVCNRAAQATAEIFGGAAFSDELPISALPELREALADRRGLGQHPGAAHRRRRARLEVAWTATARPRRRASRCASACCSRPPTTPRRRLSSTWRSTASWSRPRPSSASTRSSAGSTSSAPSCGTTSRSRTSRTWPPSRRSCGWRRESSSSRCSTPCRSRRTWRPSMSSPAGGRSSAPPSATPSASSPPSAYGGRTGLRDSRRGSS